MRIDALRQALHATGAKDCHVDRVLRAWTQAKALDSGPRHQPAADFLPLGLRHALPTLAAQLAGLPRAGVRGWTCGGVSSHAASHPVSIRA